MPYLEKDKWKKIENNWQYIQEMNQQSDYKQIKNLHACFKVRAWCISFVLNLQFSLRLCIIFIFC